jgi:hypothetical protein
MPDVLPDAVITARIEADRVSLPLNPGGAARCTHESKIVPV